MNVGHLVELADAIEGGLLPLGFNVKVTVWDNGAFRIGRVTDVSGRGHDVVAGIDGWAFSLMEGRLVDASDFNYLVMFKNARRMAQWMGLDPVSIDRLFNQSNHPNLDRWSVGFTLADWWGDTTVAEAVWTIRNLAETGEVTWR